MKTFLHVADLGSLDKALAEAAEMSSGGNYENSNAENVGDTHYWGVWHGSEPFTAYRSHHYRFLSEFAWWLRWSCPPN